MRRLCLLLLAAVALAGCSTPPPIPRHTRSAQPVASEGWEIDLPADLQQVRLHAQPGALFVTGRAGQGADARRVTLCLDLATGAPRWVHELADPAQQEVEVFFAGELLLLVDRAQALALRQGSGEVAWVHRDPDLRPIYAAFVEADDLVLSLNNETLLWLGARDGRPRGRVALGGASLKQLARAPGGLVALLIRAEPQPELLGAVLNGEGDPAVEAALAPAWSLPIQSWSSPASSIGPVVLSRFDPDAWSAVDAATGALLWRAPEAGLSGGFLMTPGALYLGRAGQAGAPGEPPIPAALLRIDPRVSPDAAPRWSLELPSARAPLGIEPSPSPGEVLGATADTFFVFSEEAGALAWVYSFQEGREPGPWANASANAEALFLFFAPTQGGGGRLKRVPILREALPRPGLPPGPPPPQRGGGGRGGNPGRGRGHSLIFLSASMAWTCWARKSW